jgi:hypothetical protein
MSGWLNEDGTATTTCLTGDRLKQRELQIRKTLALGNVVRFYRGDLWKDIDKFEPDEMGDVLAFRMSANCVSPYVCWTSTDYEVAPESK